MMRLVNALLRRRPAAVVCLLTGVLLLPSGCLPKRSDAPAMLFSTPGTSEGGQSPPLSAHAAIHDDGRVTMSLVNAGPAPLRLNYLLDQYVAQTYDGRVLPLDKGDLLRYPDVADSGSGASLTIRLPPDLKPQQIARLTAKTNFGNTVMTLTPSGFSTPVIGASLGHPDPTAYMSPVVEPGSTLRDAADPVLVPPSPAALPADPRVQGTPPAPRPSASQLPGGPGGEPPPIGTVPVLVEFEQEVGTLLKAKVWWDTADQSVLVSHGRKRTFHVTRGRHDFFVTCPLPGVAVTKAHVPLHVTGDPPLRVVLYALPKNMGVDLTIQVWQAERKVWEQLFQPEPLT